MKSLKSWVVFFICWTCFLFGMLWVLNLCSSYSEAGEIYISKAFPTRNVIIYPDNVKQMTDKEYYTWATQKNRQAEEDWSTEQSQYYYTEGSIINMDMNYGNSFLPTKVFYDSYKYRRRFINPNYTAPKPLTIINPYVKPN